MTGHFEPDEPECAWVVEANHPDRCMRLLGSFSFIRGAEAWTVEEGYVVDGASIPRALWTVVGSPYTDRYRRGSIIHDKLCNDAGDDPEARESADRVFYHACRAGGCGVFQSTLLFIGVRFGAWLRAVPQWRSLAEDASGSRVSLTSSEEQIIRDCAHVASMVLADGEVDDPGVISERTNAAMRKLTGRRLPGA